MWSQTATIQFTNRNRTATIAIVSGVGPQVVVQQVDLSLLVRFVHEDDAWPDAFFRELEDAQLYAVHTPGKIVYTPTLRMTAHPVRWMLTGSVPRFFRNLDDVIAYSRALAGSPVTT